MRELDSSLSDAIDTSSQIKVEDCELFYTTESFFDEFNDMPEVDEVVSEFGHSNPNHLNEPSRCESREDKPKAKQINVYIDLDMFKLLVPAAAIAGVAILALGYRKQGKLINGLKAIKNPLKSTKKD